MSNFDQLPFGGGVSIGNEPGNVAGNAAWASLKNVNKMLGILVASGAGALTVSLEQAKDLSGTGAKALGIERIHRKKDAPAGDIFVAIDGIDNENPAASVDTSVLPLTAATVSDLLLIRVRPHDLDVENGFNCVRVVVGGPGAAAGVVLYMPEGTAYSGADAKGVLAA